MRVSTVLLCALLDITARKNIELKLEEARRAADAANSAKSTFLATMSHEIRTPLNAILGNLELLAHSELSAVQGRRLRTIDTASAALLDIINNVLDLSKVESNQMVVEAVPFELGRLLRETVSVFAPLAEAKNVRLTCELDNGLARFYRGDAARLRQIMSNLVSNSIKFTERGGVRIFAFETRDVAGNAMVELHVSDTGIGISKEDLPTIFDLYAQANVSIHRRFGGTGLGLHLCQRLVRLMGGSMTVKSTSGVGSVFAVRLPLLAEPNAFPAQSSEKPVGASNCAEQMDTAPIRVLVAEDHPASRELLRDQLELLGYEADIVENGSEALRAFGEKSYDVVLTDLGMPVLDGYALAVCIRDQKKSQPVIAMTARTTVDEHRRCFDAGIVDVVVKPLSLAALDRALRRSVGISERRSSAAAEHDSLRDLSNGVRLALRDSTLGSLAEIGIAATAGDLDTVAAHVHSIKGGFAMAREISIVMQCEQLERVLLTEGLAGMELLWPALERDIRGALSGSSLRVNEDSG